MWVTKNRILVNRHHYILVVDKKSPILRVLDGNIGHESNTACRKFGFLCFRPVEQALAILACDDFPEVVHGMSASTVSTISEKVLYRCGRDRVEVISMHA